jgi:hypothetical protein
MTDQNNFNGQGGKISFFSHVGALKEKIPLSGMNLILVIQGAEFGILK